ncbi:MAG: hypothetical protein QNJ07_12415, partial [Woeseiaceae bacterium]|nr:hypothetical protein [Woeseiaceae bacterium]
MHALASRRLSRIFTFIIPTLFLAGCFGEGDGQQRIINSPVPPEPPVPPGFCDPVNFEPQCPQPTGFTDFEGGVITVEDVADLPPVIAAGNDSQRVGRMLKFEAASGLTFGGSIINLSVPFDVQAGSSFTVDVYATRSVRVLLQPEPQGQGTGVEVTHGGTGWETMTFPLPSLSGTVSGITLIFDNGVLGDADNDPSQCTAATPCDWTFYFDNITLVPGSGGGPGPGGAPTTSAPTPTQDAANVISLYSDAYTDIATTWPTDWSVPNNTTSDVTIDGGLVKEHLDVSFIG